MIKTVSKGRRRQAEFRKILESRGYVCDTAKFSRWGSTDFFGLFDICAINEQETLWVQVKSNYCPKQVKENIKLFKVPKNTRKIVAVKKDYKEWEEIEIE